MKSHVAVRHNSIFWPSNWRAFFDSCLSPLSHNWEVCQGFMTFLCCCQRCLHSTQRFLLLFFFSSSSPSMEIHVDFISAFRFIHGLSHKSLSSSLKKPASSLVWHFLSWCIHLCSFYRCLSECELVSCSCHRLCLHSLQLKNMGQFSSHVGFFPYMTLPGATF